MILKLDNKGELVAYGFSADLDLKEDLMKRIKKEKLVEAISSFGVKFKKSSRKGELEEILFHECRVRPDHAEVAFKLLVGDAKLWGKTQRKNWLMAQLAHFGIPFKTKSTVKDLENALVKACFLGHLDSVPDHILSLRNDLLAKKRSEIERAERELQMQYEAHWRALMNDAGNANELFTLDKARFFREWDFKPKGNTIALHNLSDRAMNDVFSLLSNSQVLLSIQQLPSQYSPSFWHVIIGAACNDEEVTQVYEKVKQNTKEAEAKIKRELKEQKEREISWEQEMENRRLRAEKQYYDMVHSVRIRSQNKGEGANWDICGTWNIECPSAEDYRSDDSMIGSGFTLAICQSGKYSKNNDTSFWGKLDLGFLVGVVRFKGTNSIAISPETNNTVSVQWAAREQGEGVMNYGDDHIGEFTFSIFGTKLEAWLNGAYGRMTLTGDKMKETSVHKALDLQNEWATYNDKQYEYERVNRWK